MLGSLPYIMMVDERDLQNKGHKEKIDCKKANKMKIKILLDRNQASRTKLNYDRNLTIPHAAASKT